MDFIWILVAFVFGLGVKLIGFPPLIGYLAAGFFLNYLGFTASTQLEQLAELGILLMLFTVGLKLNVRDLIKREVWLTSVLHDGIWVVLFSGLLLSLSILGLGWLTDMSWKTAALIAFALSFSSTVCIIKILEDNGEMKTRHGKLAIGVLVMQDVMAVLFLVAAAGKIPSIWALALLLLIPAKPLIHKLLSHSGHGELLPLTGFIFALGGYELFSLVGVKGDLGALIAGMLLASHSKANELAKSLLAFKDLFLIGFFLSIGFTALPDLNMVYVALGLCLLLPTKYGLFFVIMTRMRLRARTSYLSSMLLSNYSEFGLIVCVLAISNGWLDNHWLVVCALALAFSFILTSLSYRFAHKGYIRFKHILRQFEQLPPLPQDIYQQPKDAKVLVLGMGRVGSGAYHTLHGALGNIVWGIDADPRRVRQQIHEGINVILGDGEDADFWEQQDLSQIQLVLIALPSIDDVSNITNQLKAAHFSGKIAAIARYEDEIQTLLESGADKVFNFFTEAGAGFAEESLQLLGPFTARHN